MAAQLFPPRQWFWRLVLSALFRPSCCVGSLLWGRCFVAGEGVGASRGVPAFKRAWGQLPYGPEDRPSLQKWTNLLHYQNGPTSSTTKMNLWTQYCPRRPTRWTNICDYGPSVPTNLTLKIFHRVVYLIFNSGCGLKFGQLVCTHTRKCLKCQSNPLQMGTQTTVPCAQAEDSGMLGQLSLQIGSRCAWYPPFSFFQSPLYREWRSVLASL